MKDPAVTADPAPPRKRRRRWLRRGWLWLLILVAIAVLTTQVVLWSDYPRRLVVAQLERQLGLRIDARTLSTGWLGRTTLRDVTATLPLSDETLVTMPVMRVRHTSLLRLALTRALRLDRIELDRPELTIRQYPGGRWNVQEAVDVIGRATRRPAPAGAAPSRLTSASVPELRVTGGTVRVIDNRRRESVVAPLDVTGRRDGPIVYRYAASVPDRLSLEGQLVPGGLWQHELLASLTQPDDWLRPFVARLPGDTQLRASWRGQLSGEGLNGRFDVETFRADDVIAQGVVVASAAGGSYTFWPQGVLVRTGAGAAPELMVRSGALVIKATSIRADDVRLSGAGGNAQLRGAWDRTAGTAELHAVWTDLVLNQGVTQSGSISATLETVFPRQPRVTATLTSAGHVAEDGGRWDALLEVTGQGESLDAVNWRGRFARAAYNWRRDADLTGLTFAATQRGRVVTLDELALPDRGRLAGRGRVDFGDKNWWLWVGGGEFALPRMRRSRLALDFNAWGTFDHFTVERFYLNLGDAELSAYGFFDRDKPRPVELDVWVTHRPAGEGGDERSRLVRGRLAADTRLTGTVSPLRLDLTGQLRGSGLHFRHYSLGDSRGELSGEITARSAHFRTAQLRLLDANWELEGDWPVDPEKSFELTVKVDAVAIEKLGDVFGDSRFTGVAGGEARLVIPEPRLDALELDGTFTARDLSAEPFHAERVTGKVSMREGTLRLDPVELRERDGAATVVARSDLRAPAEWHVTAGAENWPLEIRGAGALTGSGQAEFRLNVPQRAAFGGAKFTGRFTRDGEEVGTAELDLAAEGRALRLMRLEGRGLRGSFSGAGSYLLDDPNRTKLLLEWQNVDASHIAAWAPRLEEFSGLFSGRLDVEPTNDPRALGPLGVRLSLRSPDGGYRALALSGVELEAFADVAPDYRRYHLVTRGAVVQVAGGESKLFARLTRRADGTLSALADAEFERLSLDQIVHAAAPGADPMPGLLAGRARVAGDPRAPRELFGDVNLTLADSDLGNFDPIGFLYDLMRVGGGRDDEGPTGRGRVAARLDNQTLQVTNFYLFNRGVEVRGAGAIDRVFQMPDGSPISGNLVGTARPLSAMRLPFLADVDQVLAVLQANATTVEVSGTLREPQVRPTTLREVSDAFRALLVGDVQREQGE